MKWANEMETEYMLAYVQDEWLDWGDACYLAHIYDRDASDNFLMSVIENDPEYRGKETDYL